KLRREQYGQSSERGKLLDQLELQLEEAAASAAEDEAAAAPTDGTAVHPFTRKKPVRAPSRRICRASAWWSPVRQPVHAAAASSPSSARASPRRWRWCRGNGR